MIPRYSRPEMASIWSDANRLRIWTEIEVLACEARAARGEIPAADAAAIRAGARAEVAAVQERERITRHDVAAFVDVLSEAIGPASRHVHFGLTSSDVLDTALAVQLRDSVRLLQRGLDRLRTAVARRARELAHVPMVGRTHGVHAEVITCGLKMLSWYAELERAAGDLRAVEAVVAVGKLSGAVGTFAHLEPEIEAWVCERLDLGYEPVATQVVPRDRHARFLAVLALVGSALERLATEIRHLQRTEVRELEESFGKGQKGSSAMPHKRNPIQSERLVGLARLLRAYCLPGLENVALWHERDISHSSVERVVLPDACLAADYALHLAADTVENLVVHSEAMRRNLEATGGVVFSQALLLALVRQGMLRDQAYRIVQETSQRAFDSGRALRDVAFESPALRDALDTAELERVFDLDHQLRHVDTLFERVLGKETS